MQTTLQAALSADRPTRVHAEEQLRSGVTQRGFAVALTDAIFSAEQQSSIATRQLAAVILQQFVRGYWKRDDILSDEDRRRIRSRLIDEGLGGDRVAKSVRTAVGVAIAAVASHDWPNQWPELLPMLLPGLQPRQPDTDIVHGVVKCIGLISEEVDTFNLLPLCSAVFPHALAVFAAEETAPRTRARVAKILRKCFATLGELAVHDGDPKLFAQLEPLVSTWVRSCVGLLSSPVSSTSVFVELVGSLTVLLSSLPTLLQTHVEAIIPPILGLIQHAAPAFSGHIVRESGADDDNDCDSDGERLDLEILVVQLFECLNTVLCSPSLVQGKTLLSTDIPGLISATISFIQLPASCVVRWNQEPELYIDDEGGGEASAWLNSARSSGFVFVSCLVEVYGDVAVSAVCEVVHQRLQEASVAAVQGDSMSWKIAEAALYVLEAAGSVLAELKRRQQCNFTAAGVECLLEPVIAALTTQQESCASTGTAAQGPLAAPFLHSRVIQTTARLSSLLGENHRARIFEAVTSALDEPHSFFVRVSACRALLRLCRAVSPAVLEAGFPSAVTNVCTLAQVLPANALPALMETFGEMVASSVPGTVVAAVEPRLTAVALDLWSRHSGDRMLVDAVMELTIALLNIPECQLSLRSALLPRLCSVIQAGQHQQAAVLSGMVASSVELLHHLVQQCTSGEDVPTDVYRHALPLLTSLVLATDDNSLLDLGTDCLKTCVRVCGAQLRTMCEAGVAQAATDVATTATLCRCSGVGVGGPPCLVTPIIRCVEKALSVLQSDSASMSVGGLVSQVVFQLQACIEPSILAEMLHAVLRRLCCARLSDLVEHLVFVFVRLFCADSTTTVNMLASWGAEEGNGAAEQPSSGLEVVLQSWVDCFPMLSTYRTKVSVAAATALLSAGDPRIAHAFVRIAGTPVPFVNRVSALIAAVSDDDDDDDFDANSNTGFNDDAFDEDDLFEEDSAFADVVGGGDGGDSFLLSDLLGGGGAFDDEEDDDDDNLEALADPLYHRKMQDLLASFFAVAASGEG